MQRSLRRPFLVVGAAAVLLLAGGCTRIRAHQGFMIDDLIVTSVLPGVDNKASVEGALGRPTFVSQFGPERWYYVSRDTRSLAFASPRPTAQTLVTVQFDANGNVATIDRNATLDQVANSSRSVASAACLTRSSATSALLAQVAAVPLARRSNGPPN
jgi:outer membrane protein assembly factor BamE (lipoprotein component of BamABCDE complex)